MLKKYHIMTTLKKLNIKTNKVTKNQSGTNKNNNKPMHRGAFCQFPFRWIYYYGSNKSTRKKTDITHRRFLFYTTCILTTLVYQQSVFITHPDQVILNHLKLTPSILFLHFYLLGIEQTGRGILQIPICIAFSRSMSSHTRTLCCKCLGSLACLQCKIPMFWREGMREGGEPFPLAFQCLILMI